MTKELRIAVFDLDGTLTRHDTYLPYLLGFLARHPWRIYRLVYLPWVTAMFYLDMLDRVRLKEHFLWAFLGGVQRAEVERWTAMFVNSLVAGGMRREGIAALKSHQRAGDMLILLSASLDLYVKELGEGLGFNEIICTEVHWHGERLSGRLASKNCHGPEKVHRLETLRKRFSSVYVTAYANHHSDLPLLRVADTSILVNGSGKAKSLALQSGIDCRDW